MLDLALKATAYLLVGQDLLVERNRLPNLLQEGTSPGVQPRHRAPYVMIQAQMLGVFVKQIPWLAVRLLDEQDLLIWPAARLLDEQDLLVEQDRLAEWPMLCQQNSLVYASL